MKRWLVGALMCSLVFLVPVAEAAAKRQTRHSHKPQAAKVSKIKAGKAKKVGQLVKTRQEMVAGHRHRHVLKAKRADFVAVRAGLSMRPAARAAEAVEATEPQKRDLRLDYSDALVGNELALRSASALVVDQKSGEALYAKNPDVASPIASITKLMTALVTLDAGLDLNEEITIGMQDVDHLKGTGSRLPLGATLTRGELMNLALIASENRAAAALSRAYPGGREAFVEAMNRKASSLGMGNTHYVDGTGLSSDNRASAADLARLVDAASRYPIIRQITSTGSYGVTVPGSRVVRIREHGKIRRVAMPVARNLAFYNTNALTRAGDWEIGVSKTGYINEAGHCLVMQARIAERKVIIVLLDSWGKMSRIGDATRIRHWLESGAAGRVASRHDNPPV
jgi:D-alanyl-D-alanine endopeptidase (penicillin-binding protein 7)